MDSIKMFNNLTINYKLNELALGLLLCFSQINNEVDASSLSLTQQFSLKKPIASKLIELANNLENKINTISNQYDIVSNPNDDLRAEWNKKYDALLVSSEEVRNEFWSDYKQRRINLGKIKDWIINEARTEDLTALLDYYRGSCGNPFFNNGNYSLSVGPSNLEKETLRMFQKNAIYIQFDSCPVTPLYELAKNVLNYHQILSELEELDNKYYESFHTAAANE